MECGQCFPSQPFVVLTVDQFVGHGGGPLERQKQDSHVYRKSGTLPLIFSEKSESSLHKRRSLRNCEIPRRVWVRLKLRGREEVKINPQVYTTQEGIEEIKIKPKVYITKKGIGEIKHNPEVHTTQEGIK